MTELFEFTPLEFSVSTALENDLLDVDERNDEFMVEQQSLLNELNHNYMNLVQELRELDELQLINNQLTALHARQVELTSKLFPLPPEIAMYNDESDDAVNDFASTSSEASTATGSDYASTSSDASTSKRQRRLIG